MTGQLSDYSVGRSIRVIQFSVSLDEIKEICLYRRCFSAKKLYIDNPLELLFSDERPFLGKLRFCVFIKEEDESADPNKINTFYDGEVTINDVEFQALLNIADPGFLSRTWRKK